MTLAAGSGAVAIAGTLDVDLRVVLRTVFVVLRTVFLEIFLALVAARGLARLRLGLLAVFLAALLVLALRETVLGTAFFVVAGFLRLAALFLPAAGLLVVFLAFRLATADGP